MLHYNSYAGDQKIEYYFGRVSGLLGHQGGETVQLACASGRGRLTATTPGEKKRGNEQYHGKGLLLC